MYKEKRERREDYLPPVILYYSLHPTGRIIMSRPSFSYFPLIMFDTLFPTLVLFYTTLRTEWGEVNLNRYFGDFLKKGSRMTPVLRVSLVLLVVVHVQRLSLRDVRSPCFRGQRPRRKRRTWEIHDETSSWHPVVRGTSTRHDRPTHRRGRWRWMRRNPRTVSHTHNHHPSTLLTTDSPRSDCIRN